MKTQMRFQNIILKVTLILAALAIVYGLSFCTGAIAYIAHVMPAYSVTTSEVRSIFGEYYTNGSYDALNSTYYLAQSYTTILFALGVVFILLVVVCYVFAGAKRRNYYKSNYITITIVAIFAVVWAVLAIVFSLQIQTSILGNDAWAYFETYVEERALLGDTKYKYSDSTWIYIVGYILSLVIIADAVALIINLVWKSKLMKGEKALLAGKQATVEEVEAVKEVG